MVFGSWGDSVSGGAPYQKKRRHDAPLMRWTPIWISDAICRFEEKVKTNTRFERMGSDAGVNVGGPD